MWLPDCPFEVSTTNRYTIVTHEAATTARRFIKKNEPIKYLCGYLVSMTPAEEKSLDQSKRDFSIVMSSRKKTASLFMGPARFANHDCNANARLVTKGFDGMQVMAVRDISLGEEITVTYGDDYFGEANCECLCGTCEKETRNGWSPPHQEDFSRVTTPLGGLEKNASPSPYSFRKTRRHSHFTESSLSVAPDMDEAAPRKRRRIGRKKSALFSDSDDRGKASDMKSESSEPNVGSETSKIAGESAASLPSRASGTKSFLETVMNLDAGPPDKNTLRARVTAAFTTGQTTSSRDESLQTSTYMPQTLSSSSFASHLPDPTGHEKVSKTPSGLDTPWKSSSKSSTVLSIVSSANDSRVPTNSSAATTPCTSVEPGLDWKSTNAVSDSPSDSDLSDLSANEYLDDITHNVMRQAKKRGRPAKRSGLPPKVLQKVIPTIELQAPPAQRPERYPNDYIRTSLLLGEKYSRWVTCRTCAGCWVQPNGYLTRKECPRCERHSMLYGYQWPKTDKVGKTDREERVMDHRTVHRFLKREEEVLIMKRGKGLENINADANSLITPLIPSVGAATTKITMNQTSSNPPDLGKHGKHGGAAPRGRPARAQKNLN